MENEPAKKLHLFKDVESVARLLQISFAKVDYVKVDSKDSVTM